MMWILRRRESRRGHPGEQGGWVLATVIAMLGLIALIGTALFTMTIAAMKVTETFRDSLDDVSVSDSALDLIVHDLRRQVDPVESDYCDDTHTRTITFPDGKSTDVDVTCIWSSFTSPTDPDTRSIKLEAKPHGSTAPRARANIRITDEQDGEPRPGVGLEICDWQLGQHVDQSVALGDAGTLASCPSP